MNAARMEELAPTSPAAPPLPARPKASRDDKIMAGYMLIIGMYLVIALALPLYAMLSKSFSTFYFDLDNFAFSSRDGIGGNWSAPQSAAELNQKTRALQPSQLETSSDGRLEVTAFFREFDFQSATQYRIRQLRPGAAFLVGSARIDDTEWHEYDSGLPTTACIFRRRRCFARLKTRCSLRCSAH